MGDSNIVDDRLLNCLKMDFGDIPRSEMNYFRNKIREEFKVSAQDLKLDAAVCQTAFCLLKRKYIKSLETCYVQPRSVIKNGGVFGRRSAVRQPVTVPVWDGIHRDFVGTYAVKSDMYPVIDVIFNKGKTILILLVEQGFIYVDDVLFEFTIV